MRRNHNEKKKQTSECRIHYHHRTQCTRASGHTCADRHVRLLEPYLEAYGVAPLSAGDYAFSLVLTVIELAAGIMGVMYRSKKSVLIIGVIYCVGVLANIIISTVTVGFLFTYVFGLILPILYMWGWYLFD